RDGPRVLELEPEPSRRPGARAHHPGVEEHHEAALGGLLPERVEALVVRVERLPSGIELADAAQAELLVHPADLVLRDLPLMRVDRAEADEDVRVLAHGG